MNPTTYNNRFSRNNRINKPSELYSIYREGRGFSTPWLSLRYIKRTARANPESTDSCNVNDFNRLGILIKRNVFKKANHRNYFKRTVREVFRCKKSFFSAQYDIVVSAEKKPLVVSPCFIRQEVEALFIKGKLI